MRYQLAALSICLILAAVPSPARAGQLTYTDPFAYCAAVGTIDQPDSRYTGEPVPEAIAEGLRAAFGLGPDHPLVPFQRGTHWRCMEGRVYACTVGANLPCMEKAETSRQPSQPMVAFCQANPDADVIPAVVTGRATIYQWHCRAGQPEILRQVNSPDARGFLSKFWYEIKPQ